MPKLLMVAFHFPPQSGTSGLLRSLKFARYLPEEGWQPVVLTVKERAYERVDPNGAAPENVEVLRVFALDTRKHLSFRGRYFRWLALPDRWATWVLGAVPAGILAIRGRRIDVIFSTFPIATAVLIGYLLHRITGKPWVADLRDSMTEDEYPRDPLTRRIYRRIEAHAVQHASRILFTAPSARRMYLERYPNLDPEKCPVISNGYDEQDFQGLVWPQRKQIGTSPVRMLHSGLIYPEDRDPGPFFRALASLKKESRIGPDNLIIDLRAAGDEEYFGRMIGDLQIADIVKLLPPLPHHDALQDAANADALLLLQAACCNHQIPGKAYEYLRLNRPILALTSYEGDTAALLREVGGATIVDLADEKAIYRALPSFLASVRNGTAVLPDAAKLVCYDRKQQASQLAFCLSQVLEESVATGAHETVAGVWNTRDSRPRRGFDRS
jgi:glycosyltransferase involved in cell wall biosynthesis